MTISGVTSASTSTPTTSTSTSTSASAGTGSSSTTSTTGQNIISILNAGSGIDTKALAQNLVNAEKAPQKALLDAALQKTQAKISGYGTVMSSLSTFKAAFAALQDQSAINTVTVASNASGYFDVSTNSSAAVSTHQISVEAIAEAQTSITPQGFSSNSASVNGGTSGNGMTISVTVGSGTASKTTAVNVVAGSDTPDGIAAAINAANAGVSAQVVNTGNANNPYQIVLTSTSTGTTNAFTVTATDGSAAKTGSGAAISGFDFSTTLQAATDAKLTVDGLALTRSTNSISDAIAGVTLNLLAPTPASTGASTSTNIAATVQLSRDTSTLSTNIQNLVTAFNSLKSTLKTVSDPSSTVANEGATLVNDSLVRQIQNQMTNLVTAYSSTPGTNVKALRDLGVTIQVDGTLALDSTKLSTALNSNFAEVAKMLTANTDNANSYSSAARGLAGDAVKALTVLMSSSGPIISASNDATARVKTINQKATDLDTRMQALLARYTTQFTAMDTLVGQINSLKTSLTNQFTSMLNLKNN